MPLSSASATSIDRYRTGPRELIRNYSTLFESDRLLVGLNAFMPGQEHALHAHEGMDKVYHVVAGSGRFLLEDKD